MITSIGRKLHRARKERNLSLRELAATAEVSPSLLSQIENAKVNPSVATLYSLAAALSLPPSYFFDEDVAPSWTAATGGERPSASHKVGNSNPPELKASGPDPIAHPPGTGTTVAQTAGAVSIPVVRSGSRARIELSGGVTWDRLTPSDEATVEFLEITYEVGASSGEKLTRHSGREYGLVLDGVLMVELGFQRYALSKGDSIAYESSIPHRLVNAGDRPAKAVWVVVNRQPQSPRVDFQIQLDTLK